MTARDLLYVVCYDISDNRLRARAARILEARGTRVQGSVFELRTDEKRAQRLLDRLGNLVQPGDSVRMYALNEACRCKSGARGGIPIAEAQEFWLL